MSEFYTLNFYNAVLPMLILSALAIFAPRFFLPKNLVSHRSLAWAIFKTTVLCVVCGACISAFLYAGVNEGTLAQFLSAPLSRANFFVERSVWFAILWLPLLLFVWLINAQKIEERKGMQMLDAGQGGNP